MSGSMIEALFQESRTFPPPAGFAAESTEDESVYVAGKDSESFWADAAASVVWDTPWTTVLDWSEAPVARCPTRPAMADIAGLASAQPAAQH